jgi:RimJ/RimL family protein N-acetyltransferase
VFGVDPNASDTVPALLPPTEATVEQWLDAIAKHPHSWIIEHEDRLLGDVRLKANAVDRLAGRAELAISLYDPAKLGLGLGPETIRLVFSLQLDRVGLRVVAYDARAIRCYLTFGFIVEGRVREASLVGWLEARRLNHGRSGRRISQGRRGALTSLDAAKGSASSAARGLARL